MLRAMHHMIDRFFGKPLVVDAENWLAHRGAANVLLNIFEPLPHTENLRDSLW